MSCDFVNLMKARVRGTSQKLASGSTDTSFWKVFKYCILKFSDLPSFLKIQPSLDVSCNPVHIKGLANPIPPTSLWLCGWCQQECCEVRFDDCERRRRGSQGPVQVARIEVSWPLVRCQGHRGGWMINMAVWPYVEVHCTNIRIVACASWPLVRCEDHRGFEWEIWIWPNIEEDNHKHCSMSDV